MKQQLLSIVAALVLLLVSGVFFSLAAQSYESGQVLVQLPANTTASDWLKTWNAHHPDEPLHHPDLVSRPANIWLLHFSPASVDGQALLAQLRRTAGIVAQFNHHVFLRAVPDDTVFDEQWQYQNTGQSGGTPDADIDAVEAWDLATGGTTLLGDTIVVAVLDNGIDVNHVDFQRNRWYNHAEIPNNGIDDDNNGYIDDYAGWNINTDNDNISGGGHGTSVAGIIGADGNNAQGVTGVNWYVKVMTIHNNFNSTESKVLEAYSYALEQRLRYNASGGTEGAFVVATNASWGVDGGDPADAPLWCGFYDILGQAGILNCGATANDNVDVDVEGDLPTACASDYLIAVTNTNHNDEKVMSAGYGSTTIDLGAPGQGTYTLTNSSSYGTFGGTSGATPHVTGTIALLYSLNCPNLMALTQSDPGAAALLLREAILQGVDPLPALEGITATGGRLNVYNSMQYLLATCNGCLPASSIRVENITDTYAEIHWNTNDSLLSVDVRLRPVGSTDWLVTVLDVPNPVVFTGLTPCQEYEYQFRSNCAGDVIPFQQSRFFQTDGCCVPPANVTVSDITTTTAVVSWASVLAAEFYEVRYRAQGTPTWTTLPTSTTMAELVGLSPCVLYEYQVRTICTGTATDWTPIVSFFSAGCGACLEEDYCVNLNVLDADAEYIQKVEIGGFFSNVSAGSATGYQDFGASLEAIAVEVGNTYSLRLTPGYPTNDMFGQDWRIWIDFDQNGSFTSNEIVFDTPQSSTQPVDGTITVPLTAATGNTRMRILMQFNSATQACPFGSNQFGEMEDYCVNISPLQVCPEVEGLEMTNADYASASFSWQPVGVALDYEAAYRSASGVAWMPLAVNGNNLQVVGLDSCENYTLRVRALCPGVNSESFTMLDFNTCTVNTRNLPNNLLEWVASPNPAYDGINIRMEGQPLSREGVWIVTDALGREVTRQYWPEGTSQQWMDVASWTAGIYQMTFVSAGQPLGILRIVKTR
ncbi:MAG: S8 family serine peptidase [Saprospiraceae bacterium]